MTDITGTYIRQEMRKHGLTERSLGNHIGIPSWRVENILQDPAGAKIRDLAKVCRFLKVPFLVAIGEMEYTHHNGWRKLDDYGPCEQCADMRNTLALIGSVCQSKVP